MVSGIVRIRFVNVLAPISHMRSRKLDSVVILCLKTQGRETLVLSRNMKNSLNVPAEISVAKQKPKNQSQ